jgi:hypothetical protein
MQEAQEQTAKADSIQKQDKHILQKVGEAAIMPKSSTHFYAVWGSTAGEWSGGVRRRNTPQEHSPAVHPFSTKSRSRQQTAAR